MAITRKMRMRLEREMEWRRERREMELNIVDGADYINNLPDALLGVIISLLPGTEDVRTSVLSKRWKTVWKYSSHLNFDQKNMLKSSIQRYLTSSKPNTRLQKAVSRKHQEYTPQYAVDAIAKAAMLMTSIIESHIGSLESCSIVHLSESCASGEIAGWILKLSEKNVKKLSLEREPIHIYNYTNESVDFRLSHSGKILEFPFEVFTNFEVLELKNYYLVTLPSHNSSRVLKTLTLNRVFFTPAHFEGILTHCSSLENLTLENCGASFNNKYLKIESSSLKFLKICKMGVRKIMIFAVNIEVMEIGSIYFDPQQFSFKIPKLQVLHCYDYMQGRQNSNTYLTAKEIIDIFWDTTMGPQALGVTKIFDNLMSLSIDLDLRSIRNVIPLALALISCHHLKNLEINNKVDYSLNATNEDDVLPYPVSMFWQRRFIGKCVREQLKTLSIKGYTGKDIEMEFVKYMITSAQALKTITIWFVDECLWTEATATLCLLSFPKASPNLSIDLKPGPKYLKEVDESFQKWVTTLKV